MSDFRELYVFTYGASTNLYTSFDENVSVTDVHNAAFGTYTSANLSRQQIVSDIDKARNSLEIEAPLSFSFSYNFLANIVEERIKLVLYSYNTVTRASTIIFNGYLFSVSAVNHRVKLVFQNILGITKRTGLRKRLQRNCPYALYDAGCQVTRSNFTLSMPVTSLNPELTELTVDPTYTTNNFFVDGENTTYYYGGICNFNGNNRFVLANNSSIVNSVRVYTITLISFMPNLADVLNEGFGYGQNYGNYFGGISISLSAGCNRTVENCRERFNNLNNFGGFPFLPSRDIYREGIGVYVGEG